MFTYYWQGGEDEERPVCLVGSIPSLQVHRLLLQFTFNV